MAQWKCSLQKAQRPGIHSQDHSKETNKRELLWRRPQTPAFSMRILEAVYFLNLMNTSRSCPVSHMHAYSFNLSWWEFFRVSSADTQEDEIFPSTENPGSHGGLFSFGGHVFPMELQLCTPWLTSLPPWPPQSLVTPILFFFFPGAQFLSIPHRSEILQWLSLACFTEKHSLAFPVLLQVAGFSL